MSSAESAGPGSGKLCFRIGGGVKRVWDSLSKSDKLALTRFFRDAIVYYSSSRSIISISVKDLADIVALLKSSYDACKDELRRCEDRCRDVEGVRAEFREKVKEYEEVLNRLKAELAKKDAEIAKLKTSMANMNNLFKLKVLVCSLTNRDAELVKELEKYGLLELCKQI